MAPEISTNPFAIEVRGLREVPSSQAALRAAGPLVEVAAPAGGRAWIVTEESLARRVFTDPRISKDTAFAPPSWDGPAAELEPPAAVAPSLTTWEGAAHTRLRRAHAPLLSARGLAEHTGPIAAIARALLDELAAANDPVDLMAEFTTRYPLAVILELVGVPRNALDDAVAACRGMAGNDPAEQGRAFGALNAIAAQALRPGRQGIGTALRDDLAGELAEEQVPYLLFGLIFAGQLTTDAALGFLLAHALDPGFGLAGADRQRIDSLVRDVLREHPPAPFTLWRFTTTEVELAGIRLPARSPILIDILGINTAGRADGPDLTFGAGPHYCIGAQLATLELRTVLEVLRDHFPHARLAVPIDDLRQVDTASGVHGSRLVTLPVSLGG